MPNPATANAQTAEAISVRLVKVPPAVPKFEKAIVTE